MSDDTMDQVVAQAVETPDGMGCPFCGKKYEPFLFNFRYIKTGRLCTCPGCHMDFEIHIPYKWEEKPPREVSHEKPPKDLIKRLKRSARRKWKSSKKYPAIDSKTCPAAEAIKELPVEQTS